MPGKGRATGYTDYYKNNARTPGANVEDNDEEKDTGPKSIPASRAVKGAAKISAARKEALRRRLADRKAGN
jgi:hypothetical protein